MASFQKFDAFVENLAEGRIDLDTNTLKIMLTLTAPVAANSQKSDLTEIANGNGYTTGGNTAALSTSAQTSGTYKLVLSDPTTWTASGGAIANLRYAVLYDDTSASDLLIGFWDYGSTVSVLTGETFMVDLDGSAGVLTIA